MKVKVSYEDKVRFVASARGHEVVCDQPISNKGEDSGMTPPEFLLVSLGTCAAYYAVEYLRTRNLPTEGVEVTVDAEKSSGPARMSGFRISIQTAQLEEKHQLGIVRAVKTCMVHNTLLNIPVVEIDLLWPAAA